MSSIASNGLSGWSALPPEYAIPPVAPSLAEARQYCRKLATNHYENFSVATWFLPKQLRQHFYNVYAYCRISDDLGDEVGDSAASLRLLDEWEAELEKCYAGEPKHPVFVALAETVTTCQIPKHEFSDLLTAFRQDQTVTRYATFQDLLGYCRNSANPVGHLVLYLCGYRDEQRQRLSDFTCTALQLANFWQDVSVDWDKGRLYIPLGVLERHGSSIEDIRQRRVTDNFRAAMREAVDVARELVINGLPLVRLVNRRRSLDLDLFSRGGLRVLDKIEQLNYDVLSQRPAISRMERVQLLLGSL